MEMNLMNQPHSSNKGTVKTTPDVPQYAETLEFIDLWARVSETTLRKSKKRHLPTMPSTYASWVICDNKHWHLLYSVWCEQASFGHM